MTVQVQRIEMNARQLRMLAEAMGHLDQVTVEVDQRIALDYWTLRAQTPEDDNA